MNDAAASTAATADAALLDLRDRHDIAGRLRGALDALEHDDHAGWRANIDELIQWRAQPFVQGLARLARELEEQLDDGRGGGDGLPDACARLEHVVSLTEDASLRTLDLIEDCRALLGRLPAAQDAAHADTVARLRRNLSEMTAAQGYQDLTGQIILRVVELVRSVHAGLDPHAPAQRPARAANRGDGPSVKGLDAAPATQDDANQLLSALGL